MQGEKSLIEAAREVLEVEKMPVNLYDLFDRVTAEAGLSEEDKQAAVTKFYTDLTISAKFVYVGNNEFNLKANEKIELWEKDGSFYKEYTVVELPEEYKEAPKPKKTKKAAPVVVKAEPVVEEVLEVVVVEEEPVVTEAPVVAPVVEPAAEGTAVDYEEDVFEEYDEFDEDKYNEYMDTYEDQYED